MPGAWIVAAGLALLGAAAAAAEPGVAARVDGVEIRSERLERYFEDYLVEKGRNVAAIRSPAAYEALHREALDRLIEAELLWQEARRRKLVASSAEVDAALAEVRAAYARPGAFALRLERGGFTEASYAEYLRQQLSIRKLVQTEIVARISVSRAEVHAYYEANPDRFAPRREAEVRGAIREQLAVEKARQALAERIRGLRERARIEIP